jgi:glycine/D-amino acid oxidase-like deaminating enzyme
MVALAGEEPAFLKDCDTLGLSEITTDEAHDLIPILTPGITRAAYHREAMDIDTDRLLQSFARQTREAGGRIVTSSRVTGIEQTGTWQVTAGGETFEADVLVNAAGAWADEVATMAGVAPIGLTPFRRSMARIPAPGGHDTRDWPMLFGPGEDWYAKPDAGALLVSPADEDPLPPQDAWADDMVLAEGIARYESRVTEPVTRVMSNWAGLRTFAPDRALVIGEDPTTPSFFWCAGQGGYGFQTAPAAADLLAATVTGRPGLLPSDIARALSPERFR